MVVRMAARCAVGLVLAVVVLSATLLQGHRAWARDHSFLVIAPLAWKQSFPADRTDSATPLLRLAGPTADGFQAEVFVDDAPAGFVMPDRIDSLVANLGSSVRCDGPITPTLVAGAVAELTDCRMADLSFEVVLITRGTHRYVAMLSAAQSQVDGLRSDFHSILDSWAWQS